MHANIYRVLRPAGLSLSDLEELSSPDAGADGKQSSLQRRFGWTLRQLWEHLQRCLKDLEDAGTPLLKSDGSKLTMTNFW